MSVNQRISSDALYIIDGSGYIFRAFFAIPFLTSPKGVPTNAVYGFTTMLLKLLKEHRPKNLAIAFDTGKPTFRHDIYAEYKGNRPEAPADLVPQFALIQQVVDAFNIPCFRTDGFEADDLIGSIAKKARQNGQQVIIVTGDKDFMQLVSDDLFLLDELRAAKTNTEVLVDKEAVFNYFGVKPEQVIDLLSLMGDASDNVPGVFGIGQKTAAALINEYGSLDTILNCAPLMKQKSKREKLIDGADLARLSRRLVTIDCDAKIDIEAADLMARIPKYYDLFELFRELGFKRLLQDAYFADALQNIANNPALNAPPGPNYLTLSTKDELLKFTEKLGAASVIAINTESSSDDAMQSELVGISLAYAENCAAYIPLQHDKRVVEQQLAIDEVCAILNPVLADERKTFVAQNAKFAQKVLTRFGFAPFRIGSDPMLASYLLESDTARHSLVELSRTYLHKDPISYADVCGSGRKQIPFSSVNLAAASKYAAEQADFTWQLRAILEPKLIDARLQELYHDLELPLEQVLADMERVGVKVDSQILQKMGTAFQEDLSKIENQSWDLADDQFNLASPKQVGEILFNKLKLPSLRNNKTGTSTDSAVLEKLAETHPLPKLILEYRSLAKLKGTYIDALPLLVNPQTGRIHTSFNQAVTATGRLSSSDPNLQNIPNKSADGRRIREAFIAEEGFSLIALDYSQIELRILASISQDPVMMSTFFEGQDVHARTASEVFAVDLSEVSREQRNFAKAINFGLMYGMGANGLAQALTISRAEALSYMQKYHERYQGIYEWQKQVLAIAHERKEVRTLFGRRRKLSDLSSKNHMLVQRAERMAINTPIQGTAADIIKFAMIKVHAELKTQFPKANMILQVHDELVIEAPHEQAVAVQELVRKIMCDVPEILVPIVVDGKIGSSWAAAH